MRESEILSAIDESPDGQVDEQVFLSSAQGKGLVNLTNLLNKLEREGVVKRNRLEGGLRTYSRVSPSPGGGE